jgi:hypothetical protein
MRKRKGHRSWPTASPAAPDAVSIDNVNRIPDLRDYGLEAAGHADTLSQVRERFVNGIPVEAWTRY